MRGVQDEGQFVKIRVWRHIHHLNLERLESQVLGCFQAVVAVDEQPPSVSPHHLERWPALWPFLECSDVSFICSAEARLQGGIYGEPSRL